MPRGDRRGPLGEGPMTGRAMGYCAGNDRPGYAAGGYGMGRGLGRGRGAFAHGVYGGRGMAWGYGRGRQGYGGYNGFGPAYGSAYGPAYSPGGFEQGPASKENRKEMLRAETEALEEQLNFLKREMDALEEEKENQ